MSGFRTVYERDGVQASIDDGKLVLAFYRPDGSGCETLSPEHAAEFVDACRAALAQEAAAAGGFTRVMETKPPKDAPTCPQCGATLVCMGICSADWVRE